MRIQREQATHALPAASPSVASAKGLYVQYGCGWSAPEEWTNFDSSLTLRWERLPLLGLFTKNSQRFPTNVQVGDIVNGLPIPDGTCQGVYASHVLEHLALEDFHKALQNTYRILRPGGTFRLIVPDLERSAREYIARLDRAEPNPNLFFLRDTILGCERKESGFWGLLKRFSNTSAHLWMWDEISLRQALADHGFCHIRICKLGDSGDAMFSHVEDACRFDNALAMEAKRPAATLDY